MSSNLVQREAVATSIDGAIAKLQDSYDDTIVIGGPPCQAYSLVGRARARGKVGYVPEEDERHYLFREYIRALARSEVIRSPVPITSGQ